MIAFKKLNSTNRELMQLQTNAAEQFNFLRLIPFLNGTLITVPFNGATSMTVPHMLNRQPIGWILTDVQAAVTIYRTAWDTKNVTFSQSLGAPTPISVWLY